MKTFNDGITVALRRDDKKIEIGFGKDFYVLSASTAQKIQNGIQQCLDHREFLNRTHVQVTHYDLANN